MKKNTKHTRKVKKRYNEIVDYVNKDKNVSTILESSQDIMQKIIDRTKYVVDLKNKYNYLTNKLSKSKNTDIINCLPIESLQDSSDVEKYGKPQKATFRDLSEIVKISKNSSNINDENIDLTLKSRQLQLELLEASIQALLKIMEPQDE